MYGHTSMREWNIPYNSSFLPFMKNTRVLITDRDWNGSARIITHGRRRSTKVCPIWGLREVRAQPPVYMSTHGIVVVLHVSYIVSDEFVVIPVRCTGGALGKSIRTACQGPFVWEGTCNRKRYVARSWLGADDDFHRSISEASPVTISR